MRFSSKGEDSLIQDVLDGISDAGVSQCVAADCSVLQCVVICSREFLPASEIENIVQGVAVCCIVLHCVAMCCSVLQCVAECCSILWCVAVCCSVLQCFLIASAFR